MFLIWFITFVVFLAMGGVTTSLTGIWFAGEPLVALVVQVGGGGLHLQLAVSVAVSLMLFLIVRSFVYRYLYSEWTNTSVDSPAGCEVMVRECIDNVAGMGSAILTDETWSVRATQERGTSEASDVVITPAASGVKLLVAMTKQEHEMEKV